MQLREGCVAAVLQLRCSSVGAATLLRGGGVAAVQGWCGVCGGGGVRAGCCCVGLELEPREGCGGAALGVVLVVLGWHLR